MKGASKLWSEVSEADRRRYEVCRQRIPELEAEQAELLARVERGEVEEQDPLTARKLRRLRGDLAEYRTSREEIRRAGHRELVQDARSFERGRAGAQEVEERAREAERARRVAKLEEARRSEEVARLRERVRESLYERERVRAEMGLHTGADVRRLRKAAGLTQHTLAILSGVSVTTVGAAERGDAAPERETLQSLAVGLEIAAKKKAIIC